MKILVTGHVCYDSGNAAKFRVLELVRVLQELGHEVVVFDALSPEPAKPYGTIQPRRYERAAPANGGWKKLASKIGCGFGLLQDPVAREAFDIVYCYGTEISWLLSSWRVARRRRARLIVDVPEFYGFEEMLSSVTAFRTRVGSWLGIFPAVPLLADAVVVPSRRFVRLFQRFGSRVTLLPPFFAELSSRSHLDREPGVLTLAYAGSPSNKEQLPLLFEALAGTPTGDGQRIDLHLVGLSDANIETLARESGTEALLLRPDVKIIARGKTDVETARTIIQAADFSIVVRYQTRRVNFGFPSKVAEAFGLGTPIISNLYSDIADYLVDGANGWALEKENASALRDILLRSLATSDAKKDEMRLMASQTGRKFFSRHSASETLEALLGT